MMKCTIVETSQYTMVLEGHLGIQAAITRVAEIRATDPEGRINSGMQEVIEERLADESPRVRWSHFIGKED